jgi:hypothetical protein
MLNMTKQCQNCDNVVTDAFARVYGDNNNTIYRCINCLPEDEGGRTLLRSGYAAFESEEEIGGNSYL